MSKIELGEVEKVFPHRGFLWIRTAHGTRLLAHINNSRLYNCHFGCVYEPGAAVTYEPSPIDGEAKHVELVEEPQISPEIFFVIAEVNGQRWVARSEKCGCQLWICRKDFPVDYPPQLGRWYHGKAYLRTLAANQFRWAVRDLEFWADHESAMAS